MPPRVLLATCSGRRPGPVVCADGFNQIKLNADSDRMRINGAHLSANMTTIIEHAINGNYDWLFYMDDDLGNYIDDSRAVR